MNKTVVFQGDSVTDAGRFEDGIGTGYVKNVTDWLKREHPNVTYYNTGISGNRSRDLVDRWQKDTLDLKPDVVTVLIGVNDVWRKFDANDPTSDEAYEQNLRNILEQCKAQGIIVILLQPYILRCGVVTPEWEEEFQNKRRICDRVAAEYAAEYVRLCDTFDELSKTHDPAIYAADGVHPIAEGCRVIAEQLNGALERFL